MTVDCGLQNRNAGKGSRPRKVNGDTYRSRFEEIFGRGKKEEKKPVDVAETPVEEQQSNEKTLCPHCATMNLVQETTWVSKCLKCGYEKL